jgi:hypothetical protein
LSAAQPGPIAIRWARMSTGFKMLLILSLGLLPLGIIAIIASVDNARANRGQAEIEARAQLAVHAQRLAIALTRSSFTIRAAHDAILEAPDPAGICRRTLGRLGRFPNAPGRFALYGEEPSPRCVTAGFGPPPVPRPPPGEIGVPVISPDGNLFRLFMFEPDGAIEGIAEFRRETLASIVDTPHMAGSFSLELVQDGRVMPLRAGDPGGTLSREIVADFPFAYNRYAMRLRTHIPPLTPADGVVILMPVLMWLWASLIGWIIVQRLLLQPLGRIQQVISAYKPGDRGLDLPTVRTPAHEIGALGEAFNKVTHTVARHEAELEAAVVRQTRLVREVHHRVKNNLQVVASLLNLHSRGSPNEQVAAAYASIQRRVDALAVVHRNHYAELEENRGVA